MNDDAREGREAPTNTPGNLQDALGALLADPSLMERISQLAGNLQTGDKSTASTAPPTLDPSMLSKLPEVVQTLAPLLSQLPRDSSATPKKQTPAEQRSALLLALKPFLSPERQSAADSLLRISQLSDALGTAGITQRK